jgi:hypothetical protein
MSEPTRKYAKTICANRIQIAPLLYAEKTSAPTAPTNTSP